jgi:hypothetical protein
MAAMPGWRRVELLSGGILTRRRHRHLGGPAASQQQHHSPGEALAHRSPVRRIIRDARSVPWRIISDKDPSNAGQLARDHVD